MSELSFFSMDTIVTLRVDTNHSAALDGCRELILALEATLSKTDPDSEIYTFNQSDKGSAVSNDTASLVSRSLEIAELTKGFFSPTLGALTGLWDINAEIVPDSVDIASALEHCDLFDVEVKDNYISKSDPELKLDLGGIAKGYICGRAVEYLSGCGVTQGIVSIGGNIGTVGLKSNGSWTVGIKNPRDTAAVIGRLYIDSGYVSVSGDYERYFIRDGKRYHHIINADNGYPADSGLYSVAVWSRDPTLADALSTTLFVAGYDESMELYDSGVYQFEAVFISKGEVRITPGLDGKFKAAD